MATRGRVTGWTLEKVVAEIARLHRSGRLGIGEGAQARHGSLHGAAIRYAGSWARALRLAGVHYVPPRRWTREGVIEEIRRLHARGRSLSFGEVPVSLTLAARRQFGSWTAAKRAAQPDAPVIWRRWTRALIAAELRSMHARRASLAAPVVRERRKDGLVSAAIRHYGSWSAALRASIPRYTPSQRSWSRAAVLAGIRGRHAAGKAIASQVVAREDPALVGAAHRYFGSWPVACRAARVPAPDRVFWSESLMLSEIARVLRSHPRPVARLFPKAMTNRATAVFGSWHTAVAMAGGADAS